MAQRFASIRPLAGILAYGWRNIAITLKMPIEQPKDRERFAGGPLKLFWLESGRSGLVEPTSE